MILIHVYIYLYIYPIDIYKSRKNFIGIIFYPFFFLILHAFDSLCLIKHRSNPGTPTQPRRPDFIGVNSAANQPNTLYYDFPMQQQQQHQQRLLQNPSIHHSNGGRSQQNAVYGSPQRRFLSEGELVRQGELSYARSNNTVDNIRELAGSPEHGVYMWKDNSPGYNHPSPFQDNSNNHNNNR